MKFLFDTMQYFIQIVCCLAFSCQAFCDNTCEEETNIKYYAVFMNNKKIGYVVHTRDIENQTVITSKITNYDFNRAGKPVTVKRSSRSIETIDGTLIEFEAVNKLSHNSQKISGKIDKLGKCEAIVSLAGKSYRKTSQMPNNAVMDEGFRLLLKNTDLVSGTSYDVLIYDPYLLSTIQSHVSIGESKKVRMLDKESQFTEVKLTMQMHESPFDTILYVDKHAWPMKIATLASGINLEFIACERSFALNKNDTIELLELMTLSSPRRISYNDLNNSLKYELVSKYTRKLNVPNTDNQYVQHQNESIFVRVKPITAPEGTSFPYAGNSKQILDSLKSTDYLQSNHEMIIGLAHDAIGKTKDAAEAVQLIESYVRNYITKKDLTTGYGSALEVAVNKQGDCTEHAVLTAAMCRAIGIPARIIIGLVYIPGSNGTFVGHAWTEAYIGDVWIGLDSNMGFGFNSGHIALQIGDGNPGGFLDMIHQIGTIEITGVDVVVEP